MDHFKEDIVGRGNPSLYNALYVLAWALLALLGVHAFVLLQVLIMQFSLPALAMFLANAGLAVLLYFGKDELRRNTNTPSPTGRWISRRCCAEPGGRNWGA